METVRIGEGVLEDEFELHALNTNQILVVQAKAQRYGIVELDQLSYREEELPRELGSGNGAGPQFVNLEDGTVLAADLAGTSYRWDPLAARLSEINTPGLPGAIKSLPVTAARQVRDGVLHAVCEHYESSEYWAPTEMRATALLSLELATEKCRLLTLGSLELGTDSLWVASEDAIYTCGGQLAKPPVELLRPGCIPSRGLGLTGVHYSRLAKVAEAIKLTANWRAERFLGEYGDALLVSEYLGDWDDVSVSAIDLNSRRASSLRQYHDGRQLVRGDEGHLLSVVYKEPCYEVRRVSLESWEESLVWRLPEDQRLTAGNNVQLGERLICGCLEKDYKYLPEIHVVELR